MPRPTLAELERIVNERIAYVEECQQKSGAARLAWIAADKVAYDACGELHAARVALSAEKGRRWLEKQPEGTADVVRSGKPEDMKRLRLGKVVKGARGRSYFEPNKIGCDVTAAIEAMDAEKAGSAS